MSEKSADAFRTISEVAEWLGTPTHVLRFWESKFSQVKPVKRAGGRRYYRQADMQLLGGIKKLLHDDGMTIKGVQKLLRENGIRYVAAMSAPLEDDLERLITPTSPGQDAALMRDAPPAPTPEDTGAVLPFQARTAPKDAPAETETTEAPASEVPAAEATAPVAAEETAESDRAPDALPGFLRDKPKPEEATEPEEEKPAPAGRRLFLSTEPTEPETPAAPDVPNDPDDGAITGAPGVLTAAASHAGPPPARNDLAPLAARLAALRDKMANDSQP